MAQGCEQYHTIWDIYSLLVLLGDCHNGCKHWPGGWNSLRPRKTWRHSRPCLQVNWSLFDEPLLKHRLFPPCWNFEGEVVDSLSPLLKIVNTIPLRASRSFERTRLAVKEIRWNAAGSPIMTFLLNFLFIFRAFGLPIMTQKGGEWEQRCPLHAPWPGQFAISQRICRRGLWRLTEWIFEKKDRLLEAAMLFLGFILDTPHVTTYSRCNPNIQLYTLWFATLASGCQWTSKQKQRMVLRWISKCAWNVLSLALGACRGEPSWPFPSYISSSWQTGDICP